MLKKGSVFYFLFLLNASVLLFAALISCSKNNTSIPTSSNVRLQVIQLSPNSYTANLFMANLRVGTSSFSYGNTPNYFYLPRTDTALQIRISRDSVQAFNNDTKLLDNKRYSLFFLGLYGDTTSARKLRTLVTTDDAEELPPVGKGGKLRFLNGSPNTNGSFDIWANGSLLIKGVAFAKVSNFTTLPAGNYTFRVYQANTSVNSIGELANVTVQDGRLYTLYSRGLVGRAVSDTAAFNLSVVPNNPTVY
ncbi:DUF4397 domain-containing protein [Mucilaginibacter sp. CSA2-8R]|uniref:DUF4397 domain-containing protein n=1 Tax=Mucilaginibacter sp. CSA2-8R TaxID=3141542 RepID=UPI00315D347E